MEQQTKTNKPGFGYETMRRTLVLASNNRHKQEELQALTRGLAKGQTTTWDIKLAKDIKESIHWDETGASFLENALIKASVVKSLTTACVLSDDSGLEVDALQGAPGIYSSRYAGKEGDDEANNLKLLDALKDVPIEKRTARFVCTLIFIDEQARVRSFMGECRGHIALEARGQQGFGYDPLFIVAGLGRTMAELGSEEKNRISHRGKAVQAWLESIG